jgi:polyhydroxyalkanoate synthase
MRTPAGRDMAKGKGAGAGAPAIDSEQALGEMRALGDRITAGLRALKEAEAVPVGTTPRDAVYRTDKVVLYRFRAHRRRRSPVPLLIVYALANRHYVTDLQEDRSTIRGLLKAGIDVYLIDWGYPDAADRQLTLDDYVNGYIDACVDWIRAHHGVEALDLLGICQGGTFSLCYSALHPHKVKNLVTMITPVDFHTPDDLLSRWLRDVDVDLLVDTLGNIPGQLLNWTFLQLRPLRLGSKQYLDMLGALDDSERGRTFLRMERWVRDSPDQAGEAFRQFAKDFYQCNALIRGEVMLGGRRVDLGNVSMPVLNVYATEDHLVPPPASLALERYVTSRDYTTLAFRGGHIGIYVSARAMREVPPAIGKWLREHTGKRTASGGAGTHADRSPTAAGGSRRRT